MLKRYDVKLDHLCFYVCEGVNFKPPSKSLTFSFPKLESLRIGNDSQSSADFFSRFEYPNLTNLEDALEHYELFENRAPNLMEPLLKYGPVEMGERTMVPRCGTWEGYVMKLEERKKGAALNKAE